MATNGKSASDCGDELYIDTVQPAWPQSKPVVQAEGDDGDLFLLQIGYQVEGSTSAEEV